MEYPLIFRNQYIICVNKDGINDVTVDDKEFYKSTNNFSKHNIRLGERKNITLTKKGIIFIK